MKKFESYIIIGATLFVLLVVGASYAYFINLISGNENAVTAISNTFDIIFTKDTELTGSLDPSSSRNDNVKSSVRVRASSESVKPMVDLYINIEEISSVLRGDILVWEVEATKNNQPVVLNPASGTFAECNHNNVMEPCQDGDKLYIVRNYLLDTIDTQFDVYIWLDESEIVSSVADAVFNASIGAETSDDITGILVPEEYRKLEYIQSNGKQYINTGITPTNNMQIQITYMDTSATGSNYVIGSRTSSGSAINLALSGSTSDLSLYFIYGATNNIYNPGFTRVKNVKYYALFETVSDVSGYRVHGHIDNLNTGLSYDGYTPYLSTPLAANAAPIYVFAFNPSNIHKGMRLYSLAIWDAGVLVANYLPCHSINADVGGLYNTQNDTFYPSIGETAFIESVN